MTNPKRKKPWGLQYAICFLFGSLRTSWFVLWASREVYDPGRKSGTEDLTDKSHVDCCRGAEIWTRDLTDPNRVALVYKALS